MSPRPLSALAFLLLLLVAPAHATTLFGLVDTGELYASTDGGATWAIHATLPVSDAVGLEAATSALDLYLMTRSGSVYRSADGGNSWAAVGTVTAPDIAGFVLTPGGGLLVLTESGTVYWSANGGTSFTGRAALTASDWVSIARGPQGRYYALTRTGEVVESTDLGMAWTVKAALSISNAVSIRRLGTTLFVLTETGEVVRSNDLGSKWTTIAALSQGGMRGLAEVATALTLFAATETGEVAASKDGVTWSWVGAINQLHVIALGEDTPMSTGVLEEPSPPKFAARAPYPNPCSAGASVTFGFELPGPDRVRIEIFDAAGRLRAAREEESFAAGGSHERRWMPGDLPAGTYLVRMETRSGRTASAKWSVVR